ncbi:MAG: M6 family metalloprotease domain-containing protein [Prevotella sp.]|nr:M6 family metalloprotease domain-containing protein [Prevotella sp.]
MKVSCLLKCTFAAAMLAGAVNAWAVPAKRGQWQRLQLADGTYVEAELLGDETQHYYRTAEGDIYTATDTEGVYGKSSMAMLNMSRRARARRSSGPRREFGVPTHYTGSKKGIIILVNFSDVQFQTANNQARFDDIANREGYNVSPFTGSVHDYFTAQSYGQFDLTFDVVGPVTLSQKRSYYGQDADGMAGNDMRPEQMVVEACQAVNDDVTWADYDWDGDGEVDQVFILYAGQGQADGGSASTIWPHEWELSEVLGNAITLQGTRIDTYACGPELNGSSHINGIGTICHEFTHCLGIPDFYDTSEEGDNFGMSSWSLMDYGCYNNGGYTPCDYTGYERWFCGWVNPVVIDPEQVQQVEGMKPINQTADVFVIYNQANDNEYYILQNIQKDGWNKYAPGEGLLVMHVDYSKRVWQENSVNNVANRQRCTVVPADNQCSYYNQYGDTYPYNGNNSLGNTTTPAARLYNNNADGKKLLNVKLSDITRNADGTVSFSVEGEGSGTAEDPQDGIVFYESFDQCNGTGGNDNLWSGSVANAGFNPDNEGWSALQDKAFGAKQCAKFGTGKVVGMVASPQFNMPSTGKATLTFLAAPWSSDGNALTVMCEDLSLSESLQLTAGQWTECEVALEGQGTVSVVFWPAKRLFLDEVKILVADNAATGIDELHERQARTSVVYDLSGRPVRGAMGKGLFIVNGRKYVSR